MPPSKQSIAQLLGLTERYIMSIFRRAFIWMTAPGGL